LHDQGVTIWDANGSRASLDQLGLTHRAEGDLGPIYGFQWRHFGAQYRDCTTDYTGQGVDQLAWLVQEIKCRPTSRRLLLSAWNPVDMDQMALPPCHVLAQFYVEGDQLSCQLYQRSGDVGLGVPFNIASYAMLTRMVAQVCGLRAKELIHVLGDAHIYRTHLDALTRQLDRPPRPFPTLILNPTKLDLDGFEESDFEVVDYHPHATLKMDMAV
jgi:thymidylate synthase